MRLPPLLLPGSALLPLPASLSLVCPLCLLDSAQRSVLGKYITLSYAHPIWGSSSPLLWGPLHSSFLLCHSSQSLRQGCTHPAPSPSPGAPALALLSVSLWLCSQLHQLLGDQLPPSLPPAHPPFTSSFRPVLSNAPRYSFVCSILRAVLPGGRCMDLMTCLSPAHLGRLSFRSCGLSLSCHTHFSCLPWVLHSDTAHHPVMHEDTICASSFFLRHHWAGAGMQSQM